MGIPPGGGILGTIAPYAGPYAIRPQKMKLFKERRAKRPRDRRGALFPGRPKSRRNSVKMVILHIIGGFRQ